MEIILVDLNNLKKGLMMNKLELRNQLETRESTVTFEKNDGSIRVMRCTLVSDALPAFEKKTTRTKAENENILNVWDLDVQGWRSINTTKVHTVV